MKKKIILLAAALMTAGSMNAQKWLDNFTFHGFVQAQVEVAQNEGLTKIGPSYSEDRDGKSDLYMRYGVRRGGLSFEYNEGITKAVFQIDVSEGGVIPKSAYLQVTPNRWLSMQAGLTDIMFGEEETLSSSRLDFLERCEAIRKLFPLDKDMGFLATFKVPEGTFSGLRLDVELLSGNNIHRVTDGRVNLLTRLRYSHTTDRNLYYSLGASYYEGKVNNTSTYYYPSDYIMPVDENNMWIQHDANTKNARRYIGFDAQTHFFSSIGKTEFKAEYMFGKQPSRLGSFASPSADDYTATDPYLVERNFRAFYMSYLQNMGRLPLRLMLRYSHFNPNTALDKDAEHLSYATSADVRYNEYDVALEYSPAKGLKLTAVMAFLQNADFYSHLTGYSYDRADNLFTLRMQYAF